MRFRFLIVVFLLLIWPRHGLAAEAPNVCTKSWKQVFEMTVVGLNASGSITLGSVPELVSYLTKGCEFRLSYRYSKKVGTRTYWYSKGYVCEEAVAELRRVPSQGEVSHLANANPHQADVADKKNDDAYFFCYSPVFGAGLAMRAEISEFTQKKTSAGISAFWDNERSVNALTDLLPSNTTATFKLYSRR